MLVLVLKVHITQGDHEGRGVIVSWITPDEAGSTSVLYWAENSQHKKTVNGNVVRYKYYNYTSGYIHHCTINDLEVSLSRTLSLTDELVCSLTMSRFWFSKLFAENAVWYQILLCGWMWGRGTEVLVCHTSPTRAWCSLYVWAYRYVLVIKKCSNYFFDCGSFA